MSLDYKVVYEYLTILEDCVKIRENLKYNEEGPDNPRILELVIRKYVAALDRELFVDGHQITSSLLLKILDISKAFQIPFNHSKPLDLDTEFFEPIITRTLTSWCAALFHPENREWKSDRSLTSRLNNWTSLRGRLVEDYDHSLVARLDRLIDIAFEFLSGNRV